MGNQKSTMRQSYLIFAAFLLFGLASCSPLEEGFQNDADLLRLEHLLYWTELMEEYHSKNGNYPFQTDLSSEKQIGLVKIVTEQQRQYISPGSDRYNPKLDNNANSGFLEFSVKSFIEELEKGLGRTIEEKYDIQKVPTSSPVGYFYFITSDGYLIWVTCITCGVTKI